MSFSTQRKLAAYREPFADLPLGTALIVGGEKRWRGKRIYNTAMAQGKRAIETIVPLIRPEAAAWPYDHMAEAVKVCEVTTVVLDKAIRMWRCEVSPGTINSRLNSLSVAGVDVSGLRVGLPRRSKWWLSPDAHAAIIKRFRTESVEPYDNLLADYVDWAAYTGLRVEETLRLTRSKFSTVTSGGKTTVLVSVPGLKTSGSEATLPLSAQAAEIYKKRLGEYDDAHTPLFDVSYDFLSELWGRARLLIGESGNPTATLKALRRTAARHLTTNGMPLDLLRHYLRHESVNTTLSYLRLTGGYRAEEFGKWL